MDASPSFVPYVGATGNVNLGAWNLSAAHITGLVSGSVEWADVLSKPSTFPPSTHSHALTSANLTDWSIAMTWSLVQSKPEIFPTNWGNVSDKPSTFASDWSTLANIPSSFTPSAHNQAWSTITDTPSSYPSAWATLSNIPSTFTPSAHNQDYSTITGTPTYFPTNWGNITGIPSTFTPSSHTHAESDVTGLVSDLSGKALLVHSHTLTTGNWTGRISLSQMNAGTQYYFLKGAGAGADPEWVALVSNDIPNLDTAKITTGNFPFSRISGTINSTQMGTWAGSSSIVTVGTITSGTWHGSALTSTYLPSVTTLTDWGTYINQPVLTSSSLTLAGLTVSKSQAGSIQLSSFYDPASTALVYLDIGKSSSISEGAALGYDTNTNRFWAVVNGDDPSAGTGLSILKGGNVGVGTVSPHHSLQVYGALKLGGTPTQNGGFLIFGEDASTSMYVGMWRGLENSVSVGNWLNLEGYDGISFSVGNVFGSGTEILKINSAGAAVTGTITATTGVITYYMSGDYGVAWASFTPPSGTNGMIIIVHNTNGAGSDRQYNYSGGTWHFVVLT